MGFLLDVAVDWMVARQSRSRRGRSARTEWNGSDFQGPERAGRSGLKFWGHAGPKLRFGRRDAHLSSGS
jgi:hypothetical protein